MGARMILNSIGYEATSIDGVHEKTSEIITSLGKLSREIKDAKK